MAYQAFSMCNPIDIDDEGCCRDFIITIPENKYITQGDIHFKIEYTNINYYKIDKYYSDLHSSCVDTFKGCLAKSVEKWKEKQAKLNELIDSTIKNIEDEETKAKDRQTPLFVFQNIELFVDDVSIARRIVSGLDEMIVNGCLYVNQIFPGIKFKYDSKHQLMFRFQRAPIINKCLKFECHYNLCNRISPDIQLEPPFENSKVDLIYKEYLIPAGFYTGNINIEPCVKSFKMIPCVNLRLFNKIENENYKSESKRLINECYNILKLKYYKDGSEISESEFGNSSGLYHIELLNKNDIKSKDDFNSIDYKIICEC